MVTGGIKQSKSAYQVGFDKSPRPADRIVDMAFGGKMHDPADVMFLKQTRCQFRIADIAPDEPVIRRPFAFFEVGKVAGISQLVKVNNHIIGIFFHPVRHEIRADKTGTAGNENGFHKLFSSKLSIHSLKASRQWRMRMPKSFLIFALFKTEYGGLAAFDGYSQLSIGRMSQERPDISIIALAKSYHEQTPSLEK